MASPLSIRLLILALLATSVSAHGGEAGVTDTHPSITSPAFEEGGAIPARYTADGADIPPPLHLHAIPPAARSLALVVDDPDAPMGVWDHWVVWNLPPTTREITAAGLPGGAVEGRNSWQRTGYGGPAPPSGTHHYRFTLYCLDRRLALPPGSSKAALMRAMEGHILATARLTGTYRRR